MVGWTETESRLREGDVKRRGKKALKIQNVRQRKKLWWQRGSSLYSSLHPGFSQCLKRNFTFSGEVSCLATWCLQTSHPWLFILCAVICVHVEMGSLNTATFFLTFFFNCLRQKERDFILFTVESSFDWISLQYLRFNQEIQIYTWGKIVFLIHMDC